MGKLALIGAGPMGLAMAKVLVDLGLDFDGFELHHDVGGLWDIDAPRSTMYETAHLISSKRMTEFRDFPMKEEVAEYPGHADMAAYFRDFAEAFDLRRHYRFGAEVTRCERREQGWSVTWTTADGTHSGAYDAVLIANGTLSEPNRVAFDGEFTGEILHACDYRDPAIFRDKRVLVVGAGNSGCDIAVDAIHHGVSCDLSMRRGYHFVPKYVFGRPADTLGGVVRLPKWAKRVVDGMILSWFVGKPEKYGFPKPDYKLYESHPVVNSLVLYHAGHGDLTVRPDIARLEGKTVHFTDGSAGDYDLILTATGYKLHYPFIDQSELNWQGDAPHLFLNAMHPTRDDLFVLGMVEATGLGWQGRYDQAELVGLYIKGLREDHPEARALRAEKSARFERETGGMNYLKLARMAYYVDKESYLRKIAHWVGRLRGKS